MKRAGWVGSFGLLLALGCADSRGGGSDASDGTQSGGDANDNGSDGIDGITTADGLDGTGAAADATDAADSVEPADALDAADGSDGASSSDVSDGVDAVDSEDGADAADGDCPGGCDPGEECNQGVCVVPQICEPNKKFCQGLTAVKQCNADGTALSEPVSCPDQQLCTGGKCGSAECVSDPKLGAYVGCRFWSADLPNYPDPFVFPVSPEDSPHAIVVSNPGELDADVSFYGPPGYNFNFAESVVKGKGSTVFIMPVMNIQHSGIQNMGIEVESTRPVLVHQFNPWDNTASNDASLLLPENVLGKDYVILSWTTSPFDIISFPGAPSDNQNGYFTVIAIEDDTEVTMQVSCDVRATPQIPVLKPGQLHTVILQRGEVLNIEGDLKGFFDTMPDLSGSRVFADKPIAVFAGHEEAVIGPAQTSTPPGEDPPNNCCADHLEEQLLPTNLLGTSYIASKSKPRGTEIDLWRIQAADASVTISTYPPQVTQDGKVVTNLLLSQKGAWFEIQTADSFEVVSDKPIQVMQYLVSQAHTDEFTGDPSLIGMVATDRYRKLYALSVPPLPGAFGSSAKHYISLTKQTDEPVSVDGTPIAESVYKPFGSNGWRVGYVELQPGSHTAESNGTFGLVAYGYGAAVSYGYSGGLQISTLAEEQ